MKLPVYKYFRFINKKGIYPHWIMRIFISNKQKAKVDIIIMFFLIFLKIKVKM